MTENKDRSIFRKNIGRAILNKNQDPFLGQWELDLTTRKAKDDLFITAAVSRSNGFFIDTLVNETLHVGVLQMPQSFSFGISTLINKKLELGVDYSKTLWSESKYFDTEQNLADHEMFSFGGEYNIGNSFT